MKQDNTKKDHSNKKKDGMIQEEPEMISGQECPMCGQKTLALMESEREIPYFGKVYLFSMSCSNCKYHKADVEAESSGEPCKYTFMIESEDDLKARVVKSSNAIVKIGRLGSIEPGIGSNGYVTNVEGLLNRLKHQLEVIKETDDDSSNVATARSHLKKLNRVIWGSESIKIELIDPTGNSAIIHEKAVKSKGKK
jgi:zinc finger protein